MLRFLVFDLDETLYPAGTGMFHEIGRLINLYLQDRLGFPPGEVRQLRQLYYERYGTTLRGLQINHQVDAQDYLRFVHNVDVAAYLAPNPALDAILGRLSQEKVIFTNASTEYAIRVLQVLGIAQHFSRIFDIQALRFHCKPDAQAYRIILEALPASGPECLLIEDNRRNLRAGKEAGMHTFLVGAEAGQEDGADFTGDILHIAEIVRAIGQGR